MGCGASTAAAGDVKTAAVAPLRGEEKAASLNAEAFEEDGDQLGALPGEAPAAMKNFGNAIEDRHAGAGGGALVKDADGATRRITKSARMTRLRAEGGGEVRRESSFGGAAAQAERRAAVSARAVSIEDSDEASSGLASVRNIETMLARATTQLAKRMGTRGEAAGQAYSAREEEVVRRSSMQQPPPDGAERELVRASLRGNILFSELEDGLLEQIIDEMKAMKVLSGEELTRQGERGKFFFVVIEGSFSVVLNGAKVKDIHKGGSFGEVSIMYECARKATVAANEECMCRALDQPTFNRLMKHSYKRDIDDTLAFLRDVPLLEPLTESERTKVAAALETCKVPEGGTIITEGETGTLFYIVRTGQVAVHTAAGEQALLGRGRYFGERALLADERRAATVSAATPDVSLLTLARADFESMLGPLLGYTPGGGDVLGYEARVLANIPLLASLNEYEQARLAAALEPAEFEDGDAIIREGDSGDKFFIIASGEAVVTRYPSRGVAPVEIAVMRKGEFFGERALLTNEVRQATVTARGTVSALALRRERFTALLGPLKHLVADRSNIKTRVCDLLHAVPELKVLFRREVAALADLIALDTFQSGDRVLAKGETTTAMMVVLSGALRVGERLLGVGDYVCGGAVATPEVVSEDVMSEGYTELMVVDAAHLEGALGEGINYNDLPPFDQADKADQVDPEEGKEFLAAFSRRVLQLVPIFGLALDASAIDRAVALCERRPFAAGERLVDASSKAWDGMLIVRRGTVTVRRPGSERALITLRVGDTIGELALLDGIQPPFDAIADSTGEALSLSRVAFEGEFGPMERLVTLPAVESAISRSEKRALAARLTADERAGKRTSEGDLPPSASPGGSVGESSPGGGESRDVRRRSRRRSSIFDHLKVTMADLEVVRTLGVGALGTVKLVRHRRKGEFYALKCMRKSVVVAQQQQQHVVNEKALLEELNSPFIYKMFGTTRDTAHVYMLFEFLAGGELFTLLRDNGSFPEEIARFYFACAVLAMRECHRNSVCYRDLKPENLIVDTDGYLKMIDMGLAKKCRDRTFTICGTPEYMAPELIRGKGHDKAVDLWALGVLLFEMLVGETPFLAADDMEIYTKICTTSPNYDIPGFPPDAADLIARLLHAKPAKRLGNMVNGYADVMQHPFFTSVDFDWEALANKTMEPPFRPELASPDDSSYFPEFADEREGTTDPHLLAGRSDDDTGWAAFF